MPWEGKRENGMRFLRGIVSTIVISVLLCFAAKAIPLPEGWTLAKSNANYAFKSYSYEKNGKKYQTLSLMDTNLYAQGKTSEAVVDLVNSTVISEINPVYDVAPDASAVVFQVVASAGGALLDSVIFMHIPEGKTIRELVLNNIFSDGIYKSDKDVSKLEDIQFKESKQGTVVELKYYEGFMLGYDAVAAMPINLDESLESKVKTFYGGKLPNGSKILENNQFNNSVNEILVMHKNSMHRFSFDLDGDLVSLEEETLDAKPIKTTEYNHYGSLVSQVTYDAEGNKIFSSSSLSKTAYSAREQAYFAYARAIIGDMDETMTVSHAYGGNLKVTNGDKEFRTKFLN